MSRSVKSSSPLHRTARRRGAPAESNATGLDARRRLLCAALFDDPKRITDALHHRVAGRIDATPHHHADLLQLDVISGCRGEVVLGETTSDIEGLTLIAVPPGHRHGYTLRSDRADAAIWLVKIRVGKPAQRGLQAASTAETAFPILLTGRDDDEALRDEIAAFVADWTPSGVSTLTLSRLTQAVARWPHHTQTTPQNPRTKSVPVRGSDPLSARIRAAVETLGQRFDNPPDLEELAQAARVSSRHFARRFRQDFGCTPHAWLAARRLDVARGLLRDADGQISDVAEHLGFSSPAAFSRWFTRLAGQSPRAFRNDPSNS
ncbi:MAG: AraC family transcriptional regulator [Planctomycetota bacterium]